VDDAAGVWGHWGGDVRLAAGAERGSLETVDVEDMPLAYLPGNALRVRVRVAGEMRGAAG